MSRSNSARISGNRHAHEMNEYQAPSMKASCVLSIGSSGRTSSPIDEAPARTGFIAPRVSFFAVLDVEHRLLLPLLESDPLNAVLRVLVLLPLEFTGWSIPCM